MQWDTVIGLEVHTQLAPPSKIFSGSPTQYGAEPNTQANVIDLGLPGVLPVLNKQAVLLAIKFGLSIDAEIAKYAIFDRKNYFYPDLPKGYQISQLDHPIVGKGHLDITLPDGRQKRIHITRAHLEEDAGKSIHGQISHCSAIDLNRAGTPLLEIVSEPELSSAQEAVAYLKTLHQLVRYLQISDANMQEGSFRCDVNISMKPQGSSTLGTRSEIKNINSFRFVEEAIKYEQARHIERLEQGKEIAQETRQYDPDKNITRAMRSKEEAFDYRYFPDPDLLPVKITTEMLATVRQELPELPWVKQARFISEHQLSPEDAAQLSQDIHLAEYFEQTLQACTGVKTKTVANWINTELKAQLSEHHLSIQHSPVAADEFAALLNLIADNTISNSIAKQVFTYMWQGEGSAQEIIEKRNLQQMNDDGALIQIIDEIIQANPKQVEQYKNGKEKVFGFFVGKVMQATQGKANPQQVNALLKEKLG